MYRISDFSKITKLTAKALRYYDEEGILIPSHRDESNSYRYYNENDFRRAQVIRLLRDIGFTISEIKDVLSHCEKEADLSYYLEEKKNQIADNIKREYALIEKIKLHIIPKKTEDTNADYKVEVKEFPVQMVASIRFKGSYGDIGRYIGTIFKAVKNNGCGPPFALYFDSDYKTEADIEICVPISRRLPDKKVTVRKVPAAKAISTTHTGSYDSINLAYKMLLNYADGRKMKLVTPSREFYVKGPGMIFRGNENNYITEIAIPFEEE